jgi:cyclophilin family peptidyl-prolyl cis-trans isomerase
MRVVIAIAALAVALIAVVLIFANPFGGSGATPSPSGATPSGATPSGVTPSGVRPSSAANGCPTSQPAALPAGQTRTVTIQTSKGAITIKVDGALSPIAAGNFVALASCHFYDGLLFHRVVPNFVIQGGDPNGDGSGGPGYTIQDEPVTATYKRGTVAMARTQTPNSQGSQFFIVVSDQATAALASANTYAIFGSVTSGMDVADQIVAVPRDSADKPLDPVVMTSVTVANP